MNSRPKAMQSFDLIEVSDYLVYLNGQQAPDELKDIGAYVALQDFIALAAQCPFCKSHLITCGDAYHLDDEPAHKKYHLWYCRRCRFWQWYSYVEDSSEDENIGRVRDGCPPGPEEKACISKLREFNDQLPASCSTELAQYLRSKPSEWHRYEPKRSEKLVADIFRANYVGSEVVHVGRPDDGGVDVIFIDSEKEQWLVQVKRRIKENSVEGVNTIRNLIGAMVLENAVRGIVVSTADHFSLRACQAVKRIEGKGIHIDLIDRGILDRMLEPVLPDRPWLKVLSNYDSEIANILSFKVPSDYQLDLFGSC